MRTALLPMVLCPALLGCATARPPVPAAVPAAAATPSAPSEAPALRWVRTSAEHRAAYVQAYRTATRAVEEAAAGRAAGTWAVILDADETVLDNSAYAKERAATGQGFDPTSWAAFVRRRASPPLPGAQGFLARVRQLGGVVAIVTNRDEPQCEDTRANFRGFSLPADMVLCRPEGSEGKEARFSAVEQGTADPRFPPLEVLAWLGDNVRDFPGMDQTLRDAPEAALDAFGRRFFVLPNPLYGSWESNPPR